MKIQWKPILLSYIFLFSFIVLVAPYLAFWPIVLQFVFGLVLGFGVTFGLMKKGWIQFTGTP